MTQKNRPVMLITGAASGLGLALAKQAIKTHNVVVVDLQKEQGQQVVDDLKASGGEAIFIPCDVTNLTQIEAMKKHLMDAYGRLDVLINNAGVASQGDLIGSTEHEWERLIDTNLLSVVRISRTLIPLLSESSQASIVNVASFAALALMPGMSSYNVVKAAVLALSETLRCELLAKNIHVSCACPAFFQTNLVSSMEGVDEAVKSKIGSWMKASKYTADDVAKMILNAVDKKEFLILADKQSRWQHRIARWFPNYFYRQKMSFYGKLK
ncbi:SDR family NAD(P)-dependent oxidoreductase [Marinicella rhabdoformis]|uniref:SDR family NAD(P)-dependent oxidoreductase n=1 Tax=Marinicella rhabdoformis TaxID=2580566 RepID=UPI0012AEDEE1|nr:SDR family NAD(P)-dependent oxidoreductase [Marinicella rhabdoformis]